MSNNSEKIAKLREEADKLERADSIFNSLPDECKLAITLHSILCRWNHADGCGWFYEVKDGIDDWNGQSHAPYLTKARMVISFCGRHSISTNNAIELMKMMEE
jgi:hypothetical protein